MPEQLVPPYKSQSGKLETGGTSGLDPYEEVVADAERTAGLELTPEQRELRKSLLEGVEASYATYEMAVDALNRVDGNHVDKIPIEVAYELAEAALTPAVVRDLCEQLEEAKRNPIEDSPPTGFDIPAGFDIVFIPDVTLTKEQEDSLAVAIQGAIPAYPGEPYVDDLGLHSTPNIATGDGTLTRVVLVSRHLNLKPGTAAQQKVEVVAHNNNPNLATTLRSATDLEAMLAILNTVCANPSGIDWKTSDSVKARSQAACYRSVESTPDAIGDVAESLVNDDGRLCRDYSYVLDEYASRALVVPRKSLTK